MIARTTLGLALFAACGDPPARVQLVPVDFGTCGKPAARDVSGLRVIAYTPTGDVKRPATLAGPVDISDFPADTEQLAIEVLGGSQGAPIAQGKTAPLAYGDLANGTAIAIAVAPATGFCPVGDLATARIDPVVAPAFGGVLVVGGTGPAGEQLPTAEFYDPTIAQFISIDVPTGIVDPNDTTDGLAGVALAALPDGRVMLSGAASHALAYFERDPDHPAGYRFTPMPGLFPERRAFHAAIAPSADDVFVIGGCTDVVSGACSGPALHTSYDYKLSDLSRRLGPILPDGSRRVGAQLYDLGIQADGAHRYVLAGGSGDPAVVDRFAIEDSNEPTATITGAYAQLALLDGGAALSAFAPDGEPQTGASEMLAPDATAFAPLAFSPKLDGARLAVLEDGTALAIGGDPSGQIAQYVPTTNTWSSLTPPSGPADVNPANAVALPDLTGPVVVRLGDGSLLVLGGKVAGAASAHAWIYRPSLVGPSEGLVAAIHDGSLPGVLTAPDPTTVTRMNGSFVLTAPAPDDALAARVLVGGPRLASATMTASVSGTTGGVALIARQVGPGRALIGHLVPGEPGAIVRLDGGKLTTLCQGAMVTADELALLLNFTVTGHVATLSITGATPETKASCDLGSDPNAADRGSWGIAPDGAGAQLDVGTITVTRAPP